jgi:hypothetical protein
MGRRPGGGAAFRDGSGASVDPAGVVAEQCQELPGPSVTLPPMVSRCARCGNPAATFMSYDYAERAVWLEDLTTATAESGHPLCVDHADRLTPPMGWTLTDRRSVTPLFAFDVA